MSPVQVSIGQHRGRMGVGSRSIRWRAETLENRIKKPGLERFSPGFSYKVGNVLLDDFDEHIAMREVV